MARCKAKKGIKGQLKVVNGICLDHTKAYHGRVLLPCIEPTCQGREGEVSALRIGCETGGQGSGLQGGTFYSYCGKSPINTIFLRDMIA